MAKQKGGLGRGLNSLLGVSSEGSLPQESASPVERVVVREEEQQEKKPPVAPAKPSTPIVESDIYSNKEDNFTIKEVVERERPVQSTPKQSTTVSKKEE